MFTAIDRNLGTLVEALPDSPRIKRNLRIYKLQ